MRMLSVRRSSLQISHKVRTYKEYHSVCPSSELGLSQPLSRQRVFPSPQKQGGGGTLACGWGVGGSPNSDEGHTLWYSLYVRTLWFNRIERMRAFITVGQIKIQISKIYNMDVLTYAYLRYVTSHELKPLLSYSQKN